MTIELVGLTIYCFRLRHMVCILGFKDMVSALGFKDMVSTLGFRYICFRHMLNAPSKHWIFHRRSIGLLINDADKDITIEYSCLSDSLLKNPLLA